MALAGPESLSTAELVALVLGRSGSIDAANRMLSAHGDLLELGRAHVSELTQVPGVGRAGATQLVAALELGRRSLQPAAGRWSVRSSVDVAQRLTPELAPLEREELHVLLLNAKNVVLRQSLVYRGNVSAAIVRVGELFRDAVRCHAAGLIIVHNHPSGDSEPSADDLHLTAEAIAAGRLLDVVVLDHIVIASGGYVSLRDRGMAFERERR
jgi:DNA repair protein RadC